MKSTGCDFFPSKTSVFPDVPAALKRWKDAGIRVYIYSSGSEEAQKLLFKYSEAGDLLSFIDGHFDTRVGSKSNASSYQQILQSLNESPESVLFLTDVQEEAVAAGEAGMRVGLLKRPGNAKLPPSEIPTFESLEDVQFQCVS